MTEKEAPEHDAASLPPLISDVDEPTPFPFRQETRQDRLHSAGDIRLLVLDDDPAICRLIQNVLAPHAFTVHAVHDAKKMAAQLTAQEYDLILLDYLIPGVGFEQIIELLQEQQPHASVIVVTAYPSLDSALHCLRARIHDYLPKPFDLPALEGTVLRCLEKKGLLRLSEEALREMLGTAIRERRKALKLTQGDLAKKTNLSIGFLSQIELGKNSASVETLYRIALGLSLRLSDLFQNLHPRS